MDEILAQRALCMDLPVLAHVACFCDFPVDSKRMQVMRMHDPVKRKEKEFLFSLARNI